MDNGLEETMDLTHALHEYCIWHRTANHSPRTVAWYEHKLGLFHRWLISAGQPTDVEAITLADVRKFILVEQQRDVKYANHPMHPTRHGMLSDHTIDSYVRTSRAFWRWMYDSTITALRMISLPWG